MSHYLTATPLFLCVTGALLSGCAGPEIFDEVAAPESPFVETAPYPRLSEVSPPPPGPDPSIGDATLIELGAAAADADARRRALAGPIR